ncbi:hypothetical protein LTR09_005410 [Extremus antarcticus]|uniref:Uncharacterized protein n=1 Tax=Extremus antarcticus TaxID=702011 RepID=A0AAJ0GCG2_9PEZI|nr:hypothetical protein LTR09_005410 [Extremus antarcticus]
MPPKAKRTPKPKTEPTDNASAPFNPASFPTPALDNKSLRMSYRIARGEQGVLTFEPYKSLLLPHWRFKTLPIAHTSSTTLKSAFNHYVSAGDFVGADMARKFIQMGMTRAKRYANHKGGKKYDRSAREVEREGGGRKELAKSEGHEGQEEKTAVSELFKGVWRACTGDEGYLALKGEFQREQKVWDKMEKTKKKAKGEESVNEEEGEEEDGEVKTEVKQEGDSDS